MRGSILSRSDPPFGFGPKVRLKLVGTRDLNDTSLMAPAHAAKSYTAIDSAQCQAATSEVMPHKGPDVRPRRRPVPYPTLSTTPSTGGRRFLVGCCDPGRTRSAHASGMH
jgi:hypothetical protein